MTVTPDAVLDVIVEETSIEREKLTRDATLESLGIASLDVVSIIFTVEDRYGLIVETEDLKGAETLGDLIDRITAKSEAEVAKA